MGLPIGNTKVKPVGGPFNNLHVPTGLLPVPAHITHQGFVVVVNIIKVDTAAQTKLIILEPFSDNNEHRNSNSIIVDKKEDNYHPSGMGVDSNFNSCTAARRDRYASTNEVQRLGWKLLLGCRNQITVCANTILQACQKSSAIF